MRNAKTFLSLRKNGEKEISRGPVSELFYSIISLFTMRINIFKANFSNGSIGNCKMMF